MKAHVLKSYKAADKAPAAKRLEQPPLDKFQEWLVSFGAFIGGHHGYKSELAQHLGISNSSVTRYFIARTHELTVSLFFKAVAWQETKRGRHYWGTEAPGIKFLSWTLAEPEPGREA